MAIQGAFTIILNRNKNKVLLVRRRDIPIWDLPGGRLYNYETQEVCVVREAFEETGYNVRTASIT